MSPATVGAGRVAPKPIVTLSGPGRSSVATFGVLPPSAAAETVDAEVRVSFAFAADGVGLASSRDAVARSDTALFVLAGFNRPREDTNRVSIGASDPSAARARVGVWVITWVIVPLGFAYVVVASPRSPTTSTRWCVRRAVANAVAASECDPRLVEWLVPVFACFPVR